MAVVLGTVACNEREVLDQQTKTTDFDNSSIASMSSTRVLTDAQIESIASMHNTYLAEVEPNLDWTASDMYAEIESDFMAVNSNGLTLSTSEKSDYLDFNLDETDGYNFLSQNLSSSAMNIIDDAKDYVDNTSFWLQF